MEDRRNPRAFGKLWTEVSTELLLHQPRHQSNRGRSASLGKVEFTYGLFLAKILPALQKFIEKVPNLGLLSRVYAFKLLRAMFWRKKFPLVEKNPTSPESLLFSAEIEEMLTFPENIKVDNFGTFIVKTLIVNKVQGDFLNPAFASMDRVLKSKVALSAIKSVLDQMQDTVYSLSTVYAYVQKAWEHMKVNLYTYDSCKGDPGITLHQGLVFIRGNLYNCMWHDCGLDTHPMGLYAAGAIDTLLHELIHILSRVNKLPVTETPTKVSCNFYGNVYFSLHS